MPRPGPPPLVGLFLAMCLALTHSARADLRVNAGYSESADLFSLMDNVSLWSPEGFNDPEYREYWVETFGWNAEDQAGAGDEGGDEEAERDAHRRSSFTRRSARARRRC